jgi:hypothetical protein
MKTEMTITIQLSEPYLSVLRKWSSISRTLNAAKIVCDKFTYVENVERSDKETAYWCKHELDIIEPALDALHQIVRNEIWKKDKE